MHYSCVLAHFLVDTCCGLGVLSGALEPWQLDLDPGEDEWILFLVLYIFLSIQTLVLLSLHIHMNHTRVSMTFVCVALQC